MPRHISLDTTAIISLIIFFFLRHDMLMPLLLVFIIDTHAIRH